MYKLMSSFLLLAVISHSLYAKESDLALDEELKWLRAESMVEVVSKQKEDKNSSAGIVSVITYQDIERYGANNLADVLNRVTSIYMLSTSLWMNGIAAMRGDTFTPVNNHTLVLINGRPVRDGLNGGLNSFVFRDFPIHQLEQIEVIRGAGSVLYGTNAFSAVINLVTKKKPDNKLVLRGRYGSFNTGQVETEFAWKNAQAFVTGAVRQRDSKGWLFSAIGSDKQTSRFRTDEEDSSASFYGQWQNFTVNGFVANGHYNDFGGGFTNVHNAMDNHKVFLDIGYKKQINSHWLAQANLTYNFIDYDLIQATAVTTGQEHSLLFENTHFLNFFDKKLNVLIGGLTELQSSPDPHYRHLRASLYSEINYALLDNLKITAGGQWNHFEHLEKPPTPTTVKDKATNGLVGRLGLVYNITPHLGLKVLYSQAFRSASAFELDSAGVALDGDRNLQPEQIETVDAQVFYHTQNYEASLTAFRSRESNLIVRTPISNLRLKIINGGSVVFEGLELETKAKLYEGLNWTVAYTFQTNRDGNKQNNITPVPNHLMKAGLSYDLTPDLQIGVFDTFFSAAKVVPAAPLVNPAARGYHHLSLNARYQLDKLFSLPHSKHLTFSFFVDNLLDVKAYYPEINRKTVINTIPANPGRTLMGELAIEF